MPRLFTVRWSRIEDPEVMECKHLTGRVAFARVMQGLKHSAAIVVHDVVPERASDVQVV